MRVVPVDRACEEDSKGSRDESHSQLPYGGRHSLIPSMPKEEAYSQSSLFDGSAISMPSFGIRGMVKMITIHDILMPKKNRSLGLKTFSLSL